MIVFKVEKNGQAKRKKIEEKNKIKNVREREKRIKQKKKNDEFDLENEMVIQMKNRNNMEKEQKRIKKIQCMGFSDSCCRVYRADRSGRLATAEKI